jgi:hypothetical protein
MPEFTIVTEKEAVLWCPGLSTLADDTPEHLLLLMVEQSVKTFLDRPLESTPYVQDVDVKDEIAWHDILIRGRDTFLTLDYPVTTWTSLEKVVSRDPVTGEPDDLQVIPRDSYHVKLSSGVVRLLRPLQDIELRPQFSFPTGVAAMRATYVAGFDTTEDIPADIKAATLMRFKRFHALMKAGDWVLKSVTNPTGGTTEYLRIDWTPEERSLIEPYMRQAIGLS